MAAISDKVSCSRVPGSARPDCYLLPTVLGSSRTVHGSLRGTQPFAVDPAPMLRAHSATPSRHTRCFATFELVSWNSLMVVSGISVSI